MVERSDLKSSRFVMISHLLRRSRLLEEEAKKQRKEFEELSKELREILQGPQPERTEPSKTIRQYLAHKRGGGASSVVKYCECCGQEIMPECQNCGATLRPDLDDFDDPEGSYYCPECGHTVSGFELEQEED